MVKLIYEKKFNKINLTGSYEYFPEEIKARLTLKNTIKTLS